MELIKITDSNRLIPINTFEECRLDGASRKEITRRYPSRKDGAYYLDKFERYLKEIHGVSMLEYCGVYLEGGWPTCPISKERVGFKISGRGITLSKFKKGRVCKVYSEKFKAFCTRISKERSGEGNPMFGKTAWNKGLTKDDDDSLLSVSKKMTGRKVSEKTKSKLKKAREIHPLKARHTTPHSKETVEKLRRNTARLWGAGAFSKRETSIESRVRVELEKMGVKFLFQYQIGGYFVADFFLPDYNLIIECQGDWFHCNPKVERCRFAKHEIQKKNIVRDKAKREFYKRIGVILLELWETDINSGEFKKELICKLKK